MTHRQNRISKPTVQKLTRASAFCVFRHGFIHHKWWAKLDDNNIAFQVEMVALREAMRWLTQESLAKCTIHRDSQLSLKTLAVLQSISTIGREILNIWNSLTTLVVISLVKGHSRVLGNEVADQLARQGSHGSTLNVNVDRPKSCLKTNLKKCSLEIWQDRWNLSETGFRTFLFVPQVNINRASLN
ncbi:hypothetical protein AVEN_89065-1 [Araneus ventricosus]|uniref:RNase H type-1 domain-containing protein n=1 Tax=Araneus ventricosus TaxID=182803 RepID=A0A4Y2B3W9_ARAVE|nr:hypothetical protein AVEN_89065-1 [Araneus ventricosus]